MTTDLFADKASDYEQNKLRVENVDNVASAILNEIKFEKTMHIMDFGSGTGLLLERISPYAGKITAVDISSSMNKQLEEKRNKLSCEIDIKEIDLEKADIEQKFDGIISSMTMHHIQDVEQMFRKFYEMVKEDSFIAISDLDQEDGSFHSEDTGVFHLGFDRKAIAKVASDAGFKNVKVRDASIVHQENGDYPVFLLTAVR